MQIEIAEYIHCPRDSKRETELLHRLRQMPEEERYSIVQRLLQQSVGLGLRLATGSLRQKRYFEEILEMGFREGNASTIRPWLECTVPKLGFRKVILLLGNRMDSDPVAVDNALYWMPRFKPQNDPKADLAWNGIKNRRQKIADLTGSMTAGRE